MMRTNRRFLTNANGIINWLNKNQTAEKEEFTHQQKELEQVCNPIITKLYQSAEEACQGPCLRAFLVVGAPPSGNASSGPTIEMVD